MNEEYQKYLLSDEWLDVKIDLLQKRGCKCEVCKKPKTPEKLHVHHKTYERIFNELPSDLIILCAKCHMGEHKDIIPNKVLLKYGVIEKEKKKRFVPKKKKKAKLHVSDVIRKAKSGGFKTNKSILKAYKKATSKRRI